MAKPLSGADIRQTFLDFYQAKGHTLLPSASLVPEDPTVLLTIAGMLPFKPIFLGQRQAEVPRATTAQKCIRTNDIENVGRTKRHHTFFEMLGNFSFGDYFKPQAIAWAWELATEVFALPAERIVVSVYEEDDEAFAIWQDQIGVPPARIKRMGADDNFWASGATGPCGPCSELYYDFHPELGDATIDLEDDSRFIEFYNLVFMQYNRDAEGNLTPLAAKNIDTGMGLERMAQILQQVPNNYETDLIFPIIKTAAELAGIDYFQVDEPTKISLRVIGDHIRAVVHMIADGITASNLGRGYVLRRLIRRVVRYGRLLGINGEFTPAVAETAIVLAESVYPLVRQRELAIKTELQREELQFLKTLDRGEKLLAEVMEKALQQPTVTKEPSSKAAATQEVVSQSAPLSTAPHPVISGIDAFTLYDTYGFPLELTQEIAAEHGLTVDEEGFEVEMAKQRDRARAAHETIDLTVQDTLDKLATQLQATQFLGYSQTGAEAKVVGLVQAGKTVEAAEAGSAVQIILDQTPFYGESGGQVGDRGYLVGAVEHRTTPIHQLPLIVRIDDVQKEAGLFVHMGEVERGTLHIGEEVFAQVDGQLRRRAQTNHTATHLLQAALKKIVDSEISQAGSLVAFDRLRFDFNCPRALTADELQQVENQVNNWITEGHSATIATMPIAEATAKGAIAMFGEKYGEQVRVVDYPGVSMELCGGIHVANTAEIGLFKIIGESGISAGVRRIEAVTGQSALDYLNLRDRVVRELGDRFKAKPEELPDRVAALQEDLKQTQKQLTALKSELAIAKSDSLLAQAVPIGAFKVLVAQLEDVDAASLQAAAERLMHKLGDSAVVLGSVSEPGKVSLVAAFSPAVVQQGLNAGKFVGTLAKLCGGGGGGRPNLAQAGGRDSSKLPEALTAAASQLQSALT